MTFFREERLPGNQDGRRAMIESADLERTGHEPQGIFGQFCGLSKRELFAAMAMQGLLASPDDSLPEDATDLQRLADLAVYGADALLAELAKERRP